MYGFSKGKIKAVNFSPPYIGQHSGPCVGAFYIHAAQPQHHIDAPQAGQARHRVPTDKAYTAHTEARTSPYTTGHLYVL